MPWSRRVRRIEAAVFRDVFGREVDRSVVGRFVGRSVNRAAMWLGEGRNTSLSSFLWVPEVVKDGSIPVLKVAVGEHPADLLTKPHTGTRSSNVLKDMVWLFLQSKSEWDLTRSVVGPRWWMMESGDWSFEESAICVL